MSKTFTFKTTDTTSAIDSSILIEAKSDTPILSNIIRYRVIRPESSVEPPAPPITTTYTGNVIVRLSLGSGLTTDCLIYIKEKNSFGNWVNKYSRRVFLKHSDPNTDPNPNAYFDGAYPEDTMGSSPDAYDSLYQQSVELNDVNYTFEEGQTEENKLMVVVKVRATTATGVAIHHPAQQGTGVDYSEFISDDSNLEPTYAYYDREVSCKILPTADNFEAYIKLEN